MKKRCNVINILIKAEKANEDRLLEICIIDAVNENKTKSENRCN